VTITEDTGSGPTPLEQGTHWAFGNGYAVVAGVTAGASYTFKFPMISQGLTVTQLRNQDTWWTESDYGGDIAGDEVAMAFGALFLGDMLVHSDLQVDGGIPRYQRANFASLISGGAVTEMAPPQRTVQRFVFGGVSEPGAGGAAGAGGAGGGAAGAGQPASGGNSAGSGWGDSGAIGGSKPKADAGAKTAHGSDDDGGCSCAFRRQSTGFWWLASGIIAASMFRRRRRLFHDEVRGLS
jgi:hypothetical protein